MDKTSKERTNLMSQISPDQTPLLYRLTNDYLFRAVFQTRPKALEGLCRSVLHLTEKDTISVTLRNPIELGQKINSREFILDLAVIINESIFLNLEMQMYRDPYWIERSVSYTCRSYDNLNRGDSYSMVLPVIHIGFLNYDLFPEYPEFCATYKLANVKNHNIYSDSLCISVVNLNQIRLAAKEDKAFGLTLWAQVFNAESWEEINMLAQQNEYLKEAVSGVAVLTEDEKIRQQCQAREDFEYWERMKKLRHQRELDELKSQYQAQLDEQKNQYQAQLDNLKNQYQRELDRLNARLNSLESQNR